VTQQSLRVVIIRRAALDTPDGINIFIFSLAQALVSKGHEVFIVRTTLRDPERISELYGISRHIEVMALAREDSFNHRYMRVAARWFLAGRPMVDRLRPDLTIVNGPLPMSFAGRNCVVAHDLERRFERLGPVRTTYKAITYGRSRHLVATCTEIKWALVGQLGMESHRISVVPTCIDLTAYSGRPLLVPPISAAVYFLEGESTGWGGRRRRRNRRCLVPRRSSSPSLSLIGPRWSGRLARTPLPTRR